MNGRYRLLFSLLLYMVADLLGMAAVGHPTAFGVWTLAASTLVSVIMVTLTKRQHGSNS